MGRRSIRMAAVIAVWAVVVCGVHAAELQERTARAYADYLARARAAFFSREHSTATVDRNPEPHGGPADQDGIIAVPGGLVHHWEGSAFIPGAHLETALRVSRSYQNYPSVYREILSAKVLDRQDDRYRILARLEEGAAGVHAVLDIRSTVQYEFPSAGRVYTFSNADEIREVRGAGTARERLLPPGHDSGYLWRANVFTVLIGAPDGVYVETETLGLSRAFPPLLGWLIEPIARRLGRRSVVQSLEQFREAVLRAER
jgi:hypothetical protein